MKFPPLTLGNPSVSQLAPLFSQVRPHFQLIIFDRSSASLPPRLPPPFSPAISARRRSPTPCRLLAADFALLFPSCTRHTISRWRLEGRARGKQRLYSRRDTFESFSTSALVSRRSQVASPRYFGQQLRSSKSLNEILERRTWRPAAKAAAVPLHRSTLQIRQKYLPREDRRGGEIRRRAKGMDRVKRDAPKRERDWGIGASKKRLETR